MRETDHRGRTPLVREQDARALVSSSVGDIYTPDVPIVDPALFSGRRRDIQRIQRLIATAGTTIVLVGDRGVGKTSLCNVVLHGRRVLRCHASPRSTVEQLFVGMLRDDRRHWTAAERGVKGSAGGELGLRPKLKADRERSEKLVPLDPATIDVNVLTSRFGSYEPPLDAVVIDEAQEIDDVGSRVDLAALAKAWADMRVPSALVLIGVEAEMQPLAARLRQYGGRNVHELSITPLSAAEAADIISRRAHLVGATPGASARAVELADGYPWVLQRLMKDAIFAWVDRQSADAFEFPDTPRLRLFGKRIVRGIDPAILSIRVEAADVEVAVDDFLRDLGRKYGVEPASLAAQLRRAGSPLGLTLPALSKRLWERARPAARASPSSASVPAAFSSAPYSARADEWFGHAAPPEPETRHAPAAPTPRPPIRSAKELRRRIWYALMARLQ